MAITRSGWRARPDDPRSSLGWFLKDADVPVRFVFWCLSGAFCIGGLLCFYNSQIASGLSILALASGLSTCAQLPLRTWRRRLAAQVDQLATLPSPEAAFPCQIEVFGNGYFAGKDQGVVTFVDGWLHYEGLRTSFSFLPSAVRRNSGRQVDPRESGPVASFVRWLSDRYRIEFADGGAVEISPVNEQFFVGFTPTVLREFFGVGLERWMRDAAPSVGDSVLPPEAVHSSGSTRARAEFVAGFVLSIAAGYWAVAIENGSLQALLLSLPFFAGFIRTAWTLHVLRKVSRNAKPLAATQGALP